MKTLSLIIGFLPFIVFSLMARFLPSGDIGFAGLIAAVIAAIALVAIKPRWPPKIINACSLVLFGVIAILGFTAGRHTDSWLYTWAGAGVGIILGLVILALLPVMPFTEQYAKETVPRAQWSSPTFKKINRVLSTAWGLAIVGIGVSRLAAAAIDRATSSHTIVQTFLGLLVPVFILVRVIKFTKDYPDRVTHERSPDPSRR
jgi:hypothetical protein